MTFTIKKVVDQEMVADLQRILSVAFEEEKVVGEEVYLASLVVEEHFLAFAAYDKEKIIGGLVSYELPLPSGVRELYVYDIAVLSEYRGQGVGKALFSALREEAKQKGVATIFVEAEAEDEDAVQFYRTLGGQEVLVRHFNYSVS